MSSSRPWSKSQNDLEILSCPQGSQSSEWQGFLHSCTHPSGRGRRQPDSHFLQLLPASRSLGAFLTL